MIRFLERKFQTTSCSTHREVLPQVTAALNPGSQAYQIEKCLEQPVQKGLLGRLYVQDFLSEQKRRNCRPSTIRSNFTTLLVFLSYLQERGMPSRKPLPGMI